MSRVRIPPGSIVNAAITLADSQGFDALNLSAVAAALGVRPSALYNHVCSIDQLRDQIAVTATRHLTNHVSSAAIGVAGINALDAIGHAYRGFAHQYPGQYASILRPSTNTELVDATQALHDVFARVYLGAGLDHDQADVAASNTRSAIHGFVTLEHASGPTPTNDNHYHQLLQTLRHALTPTAPDHHP